MTAQSVRMMKEFRLLAWPWLAITAAATLALVMHSNNLQWGPINSQGLIALGFFAGMPVLAGLGLGSEFQYRTLGLTLAQPIERIDIWRSKIFASVAVILLPAVLFAANRTPEF